MLIANSNDMAIITTKTATKAATTKQTPTKKLSCTVKISFRIPAVILRNAVTLALETTLSAQPTAEDDEQRDNAETLEQIRTEWDSIKLESKNHQYFELQGLSFTNPHPEVFAFSYLATVSTAGVWQYLSGDILDLSISASSSRVLLAFLEQTFCYDATPGSTGILLRKLSESGKTKPSLSTKSPTFILVPRLDEESHQLELRAYGLVNLNQSAAFAYLSSPSYHASVSPSSPLDTTSTELTLNSLEEEFIQHCFDSIATLCDDKDIDAPPFATLSSFIESLWLLPKVTSNLVDDEHQQRDHDYEPLQPASSNNEEMASLPTGLSMSGTAFSCSTALGGPSRANVSNHTDNDNDGGAMGNDGGANDEDENAVEDVGSKNRETIKHYIRELFKRRKLVSREQDPQEYKKQYFAVYSVVTFQLRKELNVSRISKQTVWSLIKEVVEFIFPSSSRKDK